MAGTDRAALIDLWRGEAEEARAQAARVKDGSISQELLLSIAATYLRLAERAERDVHAPLPPLKPPREPSMVVERMRGTKRRR